MTIQMKDRLILSDQEYDVLVGMVDGKFERIFNILDLDLNHENSFNTACFQGYNGEYSINEGRFKLKELEVNLEDTDTLINGIKAIKQKTIMEYFINKYPKGVKRPKVKDINKPKNEEDYADLRDHSLFNCRFEDVNIDINFTGDIIIGYGEGEKKEFHHRDSLDAWIDRYEKLMKLTLKEGEMILLKELSTEDIYEIKKEEQRIEEEVIRLIREEEEEEKNRSVN